MQNKTNKKENSVGKLYLVFSANVDQMALASCTIYVSSKTCFSLSPLIIIHFPHYFGKIHEKGTILFIILSKG